MNPLDDASLRRTFDALEQATPFQSDQARIQRAARVAAQQATLRRRRRSAWIAGLAVAAAGLLWCAIPSHDVPPETPVTVGDVAEESPTEWLFALERQLQTPTGSHIPLRRGSASLSAVSLREGARPLVVFGDQVIDLDHVWRSQTSSSGDDSR